MEVRFREIRSWLIGYTSRFSVKTAYYVRYLPECESSYVRREGEGGGRKRFHLHRLLVFVRRFTFLCFLEALLVFNANKRVGGNCKGGERKGKLSLS